MAKQIPAKLQDMTVYRAGSNDTIGTGEIELPNFEALSETLSASGVSGDIDIPTSGHFGSQTVKINWNAITKGQFELLKSGVQALEIRGAQQIIDIATNQLVLSGVKIVIRGFGKNMSLGKFAKNSPTEGSNEIEITYIKIFINNVAEFELDKVNYIYRIGGVDQNAEVRAILGLS